MKEAAVAAEGAGAAVCSQLGSGKMAPEAASRGNSGGRRNGGATVADAKAAQGQTRLNQKAVAIAAEMVTAATVAVS